MPRVFQVFQSCKNSARKTGDVVNTGVCQWTKRWLGPVQLCWASRHLGLQNFAPMRKHGSLNQGRNRLNVETMLDHPITRHRMTVSISAQMAKTEIPPRQWWKIPQNVYSTNLYADNLLKLLVKNKQHQKVSTVPYDCSDTQYHKRHILATQRLQEQSILRE